MKIQTYEYVKTAVSDTELFIPEKPFYCFQPYYRRTIRIIPRIWDKASVSSLVEGEVHQMDVTCVYLSGECRVEKFTISTHMIEDYINNNETNIQAQICRMLLEEDYGLRTKDNFDNDFNTAIKEFNTI